MFSSFCCVLVCKETSEEEATPKHWLNPEQAVRHLAGFFLSIPLFRRCSMTPPGLREQLPPGELCHVQHRLPLGHFFALPPPSSLRHPMPVIIEVQLYIFPAYHITFLVDNTYVPWEAGMEMITCLKSEAIFRTSAFSCASSFSFCAQCNSIAFTCQRSRVRIAN